MIRRGGEKSLWSVCRKDCGKQGMEHPWRPALGWGGDWGPRLTCKLQVWEVLRLIQERAGSALRGLGSIFFLLDSSLGFSSRAGSDPQREACRQSSSRRGAKIPISSVRKARIQCLSL